MISLVLYLLPRYILAVQFIFSLIIMDTKITCLAYNLIMNSLEMPFKYFQLKLTRLTFFRNWVWPLVYYGRLFKLCPYRSAPFNGCNHESIVLSVEKRLFFIKLPELNVCNLCLAITYLLQTCMFHGSEAISYLFWF